MKNAKKLIGFTFASIATSLIPITIISCSSNTNTNTVQKIENISSTSVENNILKPEFGAANSQGPLAAKSPQISFKAIPEAKSYALVLLDNSATNVIGAPFTHWIVANIQNTPDANGNIVIPEDAAKSATNFIQGANSSVTNKNSIVPSGFQRPADSSNGYFSPFPPDAGHYYQLSIVALDKELNLIKGFKLGDLASEINNSKVIAQGNFSFYYNQVDGSTNPISQPNALNSVKPLYSSNLQVIQNINSTSVKNGFFDSGFYNTQKADSTYETTNVKTPQLSWDEIEGAKSYLVVMSNYSASNNYETSLTNLVVNVSNTAVEGKITFDPSNPSNIYGLNSSTTQNVIATGASSLVAENLKVNQTYFNPQFASDQIVVVNIYAFENKVSSIATGTKFERDFIDFAWQNGGIVGVGQTSFKVPKK